MKKRIFLLFLLASLLASCGESGDVQDTGPVTPPAHETTEPLPDVVLPDKTYDGRTFTIYVRDDNNRRNSFTIDEATGDVLDDAIYQRTMNVEDRLDVDIKSHISTGDSLGNNAAAAILAGDDDYQLVAAFFRTSITFAAEGYCMDWNELPYVDFSKPWWDAELQNTICIGSKRFITIDTLTHDSLGATKALMFVKHFFDDNNIPYPYDLVRDGKWTFDKMAEYAADFAGDVNGDTAINIANDNFGVVGNWWQQPMNILVTADQYIAEVNSDGDLELTLNTQRSIEVFEKFFNFVDSDVYHLIGDTGSEEMNQAINSGRSAFYEPSIYALSSLRDMNYDFGIIPPAKFDENTDGYHTIIDGSANGLIVPVTVEDPEFVSAVLEAICYENYRTVMPAYYEKVLQGKVARDEDSIEMLDIIREASTCDVGYMYLSSFSGGSAFSDIGRNLVDHEGHNFASYYAANESAVLEAVEKINELYN